MVFTQASEDKAQKELMDLLGMIWPEIPEQWSSLDDAHEFYDKEHKEMAKRLNFTRTKISLRDYIHMINDYLLLRIDFYYLNSPLQRIMTRRLLPWTEKQVGGPHQYVIFNACLCAIDGDITNARLFLAHSHYILGLPIRLYMFLEHLLEEGYTHDKDVKKLFTLLAKSIQPPSANCYTDRFGEVYSKRFEKYNNNLKTVGT